MNGTTERDRRRAFRRWTAEHRDALLATGVPLVVWSELEHWDYFLEHGELPYSIDPSRFSVTSLSEREAQDLLALIEAAHAGGSEPFVVSQLRTRAGR